MHILEFLRLAQQPDLLQRRPAFCLQPLPFAAQLGTAYQHTPHSTRPPSRPHCIPYTVQGTSGGGTAGDDPARLPWLPAADTHSESDRDVAKNTQKFELTPSHGPWARRACPTGKGPTTAPTRCPGNRLFMWSIFNTITISKLHNVIVCQDQKFTYTLAFQGGAWAVIGAWAVEDRTITVRLARSVLNNEKEFYKEKVKNMVC